MKVHLQLLLDVSFGDRTAENEVACSSESGTGNPHKSPAARNPSNLRLSHPHPPNNLKPDLLGGGALNKFRLSLALNEDFTPYRSVRRAV